MQLQSAFWCNRTVERWQLESSGPVCGGEETRGEICGGSLSISLNFISLWKRKGPPPERLQTHSFSRPQLDTAETRWTLCLQASMVSITTEYISVGGNRHPAAADWDVQSGVLAFGADNNVALWDPTVRLFPYFIHLRMCR